MCGVCLEAGVCGERWCLRGKSARTASWPPRVFLPSGPEPARFPAQAGPGGCVCGLASGWENDGSAGRTGRKPRKMGKERGAALRGKSRLCRGELHPSALCSHGLSERRHAVPWKQSSGTGRSNIRGSGATLSFFCAEEFESGSQEAVKTVNAARY